LPIKWVNPSPRGKPSDDVPDQKPTSIKKEISFNTIKKQIGKKLVSTKSKNDRILSKYSDGND